MENKVKWEHLSAVEQEPWVRQSSLLIDKGYPVPTNNLYKLAEILYIRGNDRTRNTKTLRKS